MPTYNKEQRAMYHSPEYRDDAPPICAECREIIRPDQDSEPTAHPGEYVHKHCHEIREQREKERFFLLAIERIHADLAELLREFPVTGKESAAGAERRALVAEASRALAAAAKVKG